MYKKNLQFNLIKLKLLSFKQMYETLYIRLLYVAFKHNLYYSLLLLLEVNNAGILTVYCIWPNDHEYSLF